MEIAHKVLLLLLALSCFSAPALADLKLARPFTDNMVLQRELPVQIWGTAPPNSEVTVQFAGQSATAKTDKKGHWKLQLKPLKTSAKSRTLRVLSGDDEVALSNVLVGEVWLFSGQSNMGMSVKGSLTAKETIAKADLPKIRFYNSPPRPNPDQPRWVETSPKNVGGFSAVSFYFARALHRDLDVPVGMIVCARGGTMIQSWISREALTNDPQLKRDIVKAWDRTATPEYLSKILGKKWDKVLTKSGGNKKKAIQSLMNPAGQEPGINFRRSEMAKIAPFTIRGFGWYQGESNAWGFDIARRYQKELKVLIEDWRNRWGGQNRPFMVVQLPHYPQKKKASKPSHINPWCVVMEADWEIQNVLPNVHTAVTIDLGEVGDIHPDNKAPVGERLSLLARKYVHGEDIVARGPVFDSMKIQNGRARLSFTHLGGGLTAREVPPTPATKEQLEGFLIAGADRHFVRAQTKIEGEQIVCWHDQIKNPAAVRYAMHGNTLFNLYNEAGLPAGPFPTDDWPTDIPAKKDRTAIAARTSNPPKIDGRLDDAAWQGADSVNHLELFHTYHEAECQTSARFAWDDHALYVALECLQPMDSLRMKADKRDDERIWTDDNVQIFLDVNHDRETYVRFAINAAGALADGKGFNDWDAEGRLLHQGLLRYYRDFNLKADMDCDIATGKEKDKWTVELAIPWKSPGVEGTPKNGQEMGLQLNRTRAATDTRSEWATTGRDYNTGAMLPYSWVKGQRLHHGVGRFGTLRLED